MHLHGTVHAFNVNTTLDKSLPEPAGRKREGKKPMEKYAANYQERTAQPIDLLRALNFPHPKAINALDNRFTADPFLPPKFASERYAWSIADTMGFCKTGTYPIEDMRWGLASTGDTEHDWHLDSDGFGSFVKIDTGKKLWHIATPKVSVKETVDSGLGQAVKARQTGETTQSMDAFANIDLFTGNFAIDRVNSDLWDIEMVVLSPGTTL